MMLMSMDSYTAEAGSYLPAAAVSIRIVGVEYLDYCN